MQENHSVTVDPTQQSLPVSRINQTKFYLKAGAVLLATTAVYAAARATRLLPQWQSGDSSDVAVVEMENTQETSALVDPSRMKISLVEEKGEAFQETSVSYLDDQRIQSVPEHGLTDFQEVALVLPEQNSQEEEKTNQLVQSDSHKRKLLETSNAAVVVANPILDQSIQIGEAYSYDLSQIFSGDYLMVTAIEVGNSSLPSWLSLQYKQVGGPIGSAQSYFGLATSGDIFFAATDVGLQIIDVSDVMHPKLLSSPGIYVDGNMLIDETTLFAIGGGNLGIIDIKNLSSPQVLSYCQSACFAGAFSIKGAVLIGETLFLGDNIGGNLLVIDATNLTNPQLSSTYSYSAIQLAGLGSTLFIIDNLGLKIIDASDPKDLFPKAKICYRLF